MAASASTMVSELIKSTNDVTDVNGMLRSLSGVGPLRYCASRPRWHMDAVGIEARRLELGLVDRAARREPDQAALVVLGVLAVPIVIDAGDDRDDREVVLGRRRGNAPLERATVPRIV